MKHLKWTLILLVLLNAQPSLAQHEAHAEHGQTTQQPQHQHGVSQAETAETHQPDTPSGNSEAEHVAPEPPQSKLPPMSHRKMMELMQMDDAGRFGRMLIDQAEWYRTDGHSVLAWDATAWYGGDYHKLLLRSEGDYSQGSVEAASAELLWDRVFARWWSLQAGVRHDFGEGPERNWAALGVMGLAPYWFELEAAFYVGDQGRTAAKVKAEYELFFTQRLILQPALEVNWYGKQDLDRDIGSGVSDAELGLRLRYEIRREFAPYVGVTITRLVGATKTLAVAEGRDENEVRFVAGLRAWF